NDSEDDNGSDDDSSSGNDNSSNTNDNSESQDPQGDTGDQGGDSGMDWDGTDEGPPNILPTRAADIWDVLSDVSPESDPESTNPIADRIAAGLHRELLTTPTEIPDTAWGDSTGSESAPEIRLTAGTVFSVGNVPVPTDDWGEWT